MTSHSSGPKTTDVAHHRPQNRSLSQNYQRTPRSFPRQHASDLAEASTDKLNGAEPSFKRQKLEERQNAAAASAPNNSQEILVRDGILRVSTQLSLESPVIKEDPERVGEGTTILPLDQKFPESHPRVLPLFPSRPCIHSRKITKRRDTLAIERAAVKQVVQVKPYIPEAPPPAPQYQRGGTADYYPWIGNHPEDVLNESATKQGSYDKPQATHNETTTARPSVWSSLKHKSGLQILSSLLVAALDQRQIHGTITANCTFKPPPRVTLTDTKREAWLRDLANPAIPLRRLSRTIPHGIRGKNLLDHCLAKDIPTARAVWLAKCVGANEIRAFKRKGASGAFAIGGETKWIRDWTTNVESFVENIVAECGTSVWRDKMNYSLRLVSHIFSEHLLDQDQYLDWVVASLQSSDLHCVLVWLLVVQLYWKEVLRYRERGRRLAEALLDQLWKAYQPPNRETFMEIFQQLMQVLQSFMVSNPLCFLLRSWSKYEAMLRTCIEAPEDMLFVEVERLSRRNSRIRGPPMDHGCQYSGQSCQQRLIALLDRVPVKIDIGHTADACMRTVTDHDLLITTCIDWATNIYRNGHARIYIVIRLLRRWAKADIELDRPILEFLSASPNLPPRQKSNIYRLVAELVHSKHFSVSKYLQWLMARGRLARHDRSDQAVPCDVQLLFELPLHGLPSHVLNLRRILLSSIGASVASEENAVISTKFRIAKQIQDFFPVPQIPACHEFQNCDPWQPSQTVKSAMGRWIRQAVASRFPQHGIQGKLDSTNDGFLHTAKGTSSLATITCEQFQSVRIVLEDFEDFSILADIIKICCSSEDVKVLTAATDTVNHHVDIFIAIGAVDDLFQSLYERYEEICSQKEFEWSFVESLIDLGTQLPGAAGEIRNLRRALLHHEQVSCAAACSPISDHMAEALQSAESAFADEVEQVLTSGTSMDKRTLKQMFGTITKRLEISWADPEQCPLINFAEILLRLRNFGADTFEELVRDWLDELLPFTRRPTLSRILPPFICTAAITLRTVLDRMVIHLTSNAATSHVAALGLDGLELLMIADLDLPPFATNREYRLHLQQLHIIKEFSFLTVPILRATIEACSGKELAIRERARALFKKPGIKTIIKGLLQQYSNNPDAINGAFGSESLEPHVLQVIDSMLYPSPEPGVSDADLHDQVLKVLNHVNDFNVPLCQLKLRAVLATASQSSFEAANTLVTIFMKKAKAPANALTDIWAALISGLPPKQALQIRQRAENEMISGITKDILPMADNCRGVMKALVAIVDASSVGIPDFGTPSVVTQVTDRLSSMVLSSPIARGLNCEETSALAKDAKRIPEGLHLYIEVLLRLLTIHQAAVHCAKLSENSIVQLLVTLSLLLTHESLSSLQNLSEHVLDVLAILTDSLSDDIRSQCVRLLRDQYRTRDPRLLFLFGYSENVEGEWLQLMTSSLSASIAKNEGLVGANDSTQPFPLRKWEMMQDTTPLVTENDTSLSLALFGARKTVL